MNALKTAKDACLPGAFPPGGGVRRGIPVGPRAGRRPLAWAGLAAAVWLLAAPAFAQTSYTWKAGTGTWDGTTTSNWNPAAVPGNGNTVLLTQSSAAGSPIAIDYTATNLTGTGLTALTLGNAGGGITTLTLNDGDFLPTQKFTMNVGGAMTMTGGTFGATTNLGGQGSWVLNSGTTTMSGGVYRANVGSNGQLQVGNASQTGDVAFNMSSGTLAVVQFSGDFNLNVGGNATYSSSFNMTGGTASWFNWIVGNKGTFTLDGGQFSGRALTLNTGGIVDIKSGTISNSGYAPTVNSGGLLRMSGGIYDIGNSQFVVNGGGTVSWTGGDFLYSSGVAAFRRVMLTGSGASFSMTNRIMTLNQGGQSSGTTSLQLAAGSVLRAIGSGTIQDARFEQSSPGGVSMNGRVVADGNGSDSALNMTRFGKISATGTVAWLANQTDNTTNNGWFATNKGSLSLPLLTMASTGTINWGEDNSDTTIDLVNSMRLTSAGVTSGSFAITLLANDRTDMATPLSTLGVSSANVFSLFKLDPQGGFAFGSGNLSLQIRYDDANVAAGTAGALRLMRYNNSGWADISSSVDSTNNTISSQSITSFGTLSNGGVLLSVNYAPSAVYSLSATASGSAIRVGDTSTLTAVISNGTATVTPDSLGYTGLALSSAGALSSSSGTVAPGLSSSGSVAYTGTAGGSFTFSPTVTSATNVNLGTAATLSGSTGVTVTVWNPAGASIAPGTTINVGTVLKGTSLSQTLSITNTAPNNGFSEKLDAAFGTLGGGATTNSGSISLLAAGGTSTAMTVGLGSATAGAKTGSAVVNFTSNGAGTSGLGTLSLAPQTVNLTGTVLDPAMASFASGSTSTSLSLDFLTVNQNATIAPLGFTLYNLMQTAGFTADLALEEIVSGTGNTAALSTNLSTFLSLASGSSNSWQASVNTTNTGTFTNTWTLRFKSSNAGTVYSGDSTQTLTLTTSVIVVPEPGTVALAGVGIVATCWAFRRRHRVAQGVVRG